MAVAILHRASRRLAAALPEMTGAQQEQTQGQIENARRELARMTARIGKEQKPTHTEPGATNRDSGKPRRLNSALGGTPLAVHHFRFHQPQQKHFEGDALFGALLAQLPVLAHHRG